MISDRRLYPSNTENTWEAINCLAFLGLRGICFPCFKESVVGNLLGKMQMYPLGLLGALS